MSEQFHVFKIDDGATTHVVARSEEEAIRVIADSYGETSEEYRREHEPIVTRIADDAELGIRDMDADGYPLTKKPCGEWVADDARPLILCCSEW